ncbi:hypothetical protein VTO42DRAFT_7848 [Malbranchea cinnamomea]
MPTPEPNTPPQQAAEQNTIRLSRDDRIRVLTLRDAGFTYQQIASQLQITHRQVQYTCQSQQISPKKAPGKPPKLSEEDVDDIIAFISSSKRNRRMPFHRLCQELDLPVGSSALARALKKRGYTRHIALRKPPLSDQNKRVTSGSHKRIYVTRKAGEELEETCLI